MAFTRFGGESPTHINVRDFSSPLAERGERGGSADEQDRRHGMSIGSGVLDAGIMLSDDWNG